MISRTEEEFVDQENDININDSYEKDSDIVDSNDNDSNVSDSINNDYNDNDSINNDSNDDNSNISDSLEEYSSSETFEHEEEYFGDDKLFIESSNEEEAWADSESDEDILRETHKKEADWLNSKKFKKSVNPVPSSLKISYTPGLFKANYNIKLSLNTKDYLYLVDTMNIIYQLKNDELVSTYKIDRWAISDICYFKDKLLVCSSKSNKIKYISNNNLKDINKIYTRNINKLININSLFYILGDSTLCLNQDLEIIEECYTKLTNLIDYKGTLLGLSSNGDLLQFTPTLKLVNKVIYEDKFSFKNIKSINSLLVIHSTNLILVNEDFKYIKEISGDDITEFKGRYLCFSNTGIKIFNKEFNIVKTIKKKCTSFCNTGERILMCNYREIHALNILQ